MLTNSRLWSVMLALSLTAGGLSLTGCGTLAKWGIGTTPIGTVITTPTKYPDVTVRGTVSNQFTLLGSGIYELKDDTGSIWVMTKTGAPPMGSTLAVRGTANEGANVAGQNFGVTLQEKERYQ